MNATVSKHILYTRDPSLFYPKSSVLFVRQPCPRLSSPGCDRLQRVNTFSVRPMHS